MSLLNKYTYTMLVSAFSFTTSVAWGQILNPEIETIKECSQTYIKQHTNEVLNKRGAILISAASIGNCPINKNILQQYVLVVEAVYYKEEKKKSAHGYLINSTALTDTDIETLKVLSKKSEGYSLGYLTPNYEIITYSTSMQVVAGKEEQKLLQNTVYFPSLRKFIMAPNRNLVIDIHLPENLRLPDNSK